MQTQFVATHGKGNCVQAAIASILDLRLEDVPAFRDLPAQDVESGIDRFLQSRGLRRISVRFSGAFEWGDAFFQDSLYHPLGECYVCGPPVLIYGKSPRSSTGHAVVGHISGANVRITHDPHPDGTGIDGPPHSIHWIVPVE
jgi:hypothetical protein